MQSKKILAIMLAMGMTLTPFAAYAEDGVAVPVDDQTVTEAKEVENPWNLDDFVINGTTLDGLSASGQDKIKENPNLVLPSKNGDGDDITAIGDGSMGVGTFGYKGSNGEVYLPTSVVLPSNLRTIGKFAFSAKLDSSTKEQVGLTSVEFPETLEIIDTTAFQNAPLTEINIPDNVTYIGSGAFTNAGNVKATKLKLSQNLKTIEASAFNSQAIEEIVIPEGVESIGSSAFAGNYAKKVSLPSTLKSIGSKAFMNHQFTEVEIPDGVETIGTYAFQVTNQDAQKTLKNVNIPASLTKIDKQVFQGSSLESVEIPAGITKVDAKAFDSSTNTVLVKVAVPEQLTTLADGTGHKIVMDMNNSAITFKDIPDATYTGDELQPVVEVACANSELTKEQDYTVEYRDTVNAGTGSIIIKGNGKYCGEVTKEFTIKPMPVNVEMSLSSQKYTYNGKAQVPEVKVTVDGNEKLSSDYDLTYSGSTTNAGTYKVAATLKGNYAGTATSDVTIAKAKSAIFAKASTKTVKKSAVRKKARKVSAIKVSKAKGKITYKKLSGSKKLKVNSKTGKITVVKHKCSKKVKSYKIKVKVSCAGNANYAGSSKTITVKVKMK